MNQFLYDHAKPRKQCKSQNPLKVSGFGIFKCINAIDMILRIEIQKFVSYPLANFCIF